MRLQVLLTKHSSGKKKISLFTYAHADTKSGWTHKGTFIHPLKCTFIKTRTKTCILQTSLSTHTYTHIHKHIEILFITYICVSMKNKESSGDLLCGCSEVKEKKRESSLTPGVRRRSCQPKRIMHGLTKAGHRKRKKKARKFGGVIVGV